HSLLATRLVSQIRQEFEVELPLSTLFEFPTVAGLARVLGEYSTEAVLPPIKRADRGQPLPLSYAQQRLWFIDQLEGGSAQYNMPGSLKITGVFNEQAFKQTVDQIIERHEVLRTVLQAEEGQAQQKILATFELPIETRDLSELPVTLQQEKVKALAKSDAGRVFDLSRELPIRFQLLRLATEEHVVLFNMHHIASDGWSMGILIKEFNTLYSAFNEGRENPLGPLSVQYADYAV
ncbi:condensation domain-containing protein, partial [Microbulbifer epialgicus]